MPELKFREHRRTGQRVRWKDLPNGGAVISFWPAPGTQTLTKFQTKQWHECDGPHLTSTLTKPTVTRASEAPKPERKASPVKLEHVPMAKPWTYRSEEFMAATRKIACVSCGMHPPSQAAHLNLGKGVGIKTHDLTAALCQTCHTRYDQGDLSGNHGWWYEMFYKTMLEMVTTNDGSLS